MIEIGATVVIEFGPRKERFACYLSFGDYLEDEDCDTYGVPDENIFSYITREEFNRRKTFEFKILEVIEMITIQYQTQH